MGIEETPTVTVKTKTRILKFAEGADPKKDKPFAVEEHEQILTGQEAVNFLKGGKK